MIMLGGIHREYFNILDLKLYQHALFAEHTGRTIQTKTGMCRVRAVNTFTIGACFSQTFFFRECVVSTYTIKRFIHSHRATGIKLIGLGQLLAHSNSFQSQVCACYFS